MVRPIMSLLNPDPDSAKIVSCSEEEIEENQKWN